MTRSQTNPTDFSLGNAEAEWLRAENDRLREDKRILWDALVHIGNDERIPNWIREIANATLDKEAGK